METKLDTKIVKPQKTKKSVPKATVKKLKKDSAHLKSLNKAIKKKIASKISVVPF